MFIGSIKELAELMKYYRHEGLCLLELYAPENAGKSVLLDEFCRNKDAIYFTASHASGRANLARFSQCVLAHYKDTEHEPFMFWSYAFKYIDVRQEGRKIIVVLDSVDELTDKDPVFMDMLCKCIASIVNTCNMLLILSGRKKMLAGRNALLLRRLTVTRELEKFTLTDDVAEELRRQSEGDIDKAKVIRFSEDEVILREGEASSEMYKVISGRAVCYLNYGTDEEYLLGTIKEGQCFGEYSLLTGKPGVCTFVAYTDMLLMRISLDEFPRFVSMNADNAVGIMRNMAKMINVLKVNIDMLREETGGKA